MNYTLPDLPFAYDALEPHIDARTMEIHHRKHHHAYVTNLNAALEGHNVGDHCIEDLIAMVDLLPDEVRTAVRNHGGGHANHCLFWYVLSGAGGGRPHGDLAKAIDHELSGFDHFVEEFAGAAMKRFGSGWGWLSLDGDKRLLIESTPNQDSPLMHGHTPLLGVDVWEHAYYLKYQNRRADYLKAFFNVIHWDAVTDRYVRAMQIEAHPVSA